MDAMTPPEMLQPSEQMAAALVQPPKPVTHDVKIVTTRKIAQAKVMGCPPEEFGIERGARTIKDCNYCFHEPPRTVGDLIAQGYDKEQVKSLATNASADGTEELSRDTVDEQSPAADSLNESSRKIRVTEHYIRIDMQGNGKPCIYRVTTAGEGGDILKLDGKDDIERVDVYPFAAVTPVPITHRFFGRSIADLVMDIQRIKTALLRSGLDNRYLSGNPRVEVANSHADVNTLDDLLVSRPGGIVRTKQPGGLQWQVIPDSSEASFAAMQYFDSIREVRTGLSNQSQGIDANALQNQSATAVAQVFSSSQMRMKLIARILAEGVKDMFSLLHGTIRKHGQQAQTVRLRNTWVEVDPRQWKTRSDMTIHVGLGTGGKAQQFAQIMALAGVQEKMLLGGKANLVDDQALYNTAAELVKIMGHKNPDKFFNDPSAKDPKTGQPLHPPVPPPPDPAVLKIEADTKMKQQELQMRGQEIQANAQIDAQADERKAQIENVQAQADIATQDRKMQAEMAMAQQKFEFEKELKLMDFQLKREQQQADLEMKRELHQASLQSAQIGMLATAQSHDAKMEQSTQSHDAKIEEAKNKPKADK